MNNIHEAEHKYAAVELQAGRRYELRLDFHEFVNDARIRLEWSRPETDGTEEAIAAARQADAVVMVLGLSPRLEGEEMSVAVEGFRGGDRIQLDIPRVQEELLRKIVAVGKPVVLVLLNGSAVAVNYARDHVPAIVEAWYPGQAGGTALADVLFGDYNPAGRLPVTFYKSADQLPPFTDYAMKGRTYRFFEGEPLFPFGHGLSYTTFAYRNLSLPQSSTAGRDVPLRVEVENTGDVAGEEVVEVYAKRLGGGAGTPLRSLAGFERIALGPHQRKTVEITLPARSLSDRATYEISAGGGQQPAVSARLRIE